MKRLHSRARALPVGFSCGRRDNLVFLAEFSAERNSLREHTVFGLLPSLEAFVTRSAGPLQTRIVVSKGQGRRDGGAFLSTRRYNCWLSRAAVSGLPFLADRIRGDYKMTSVVHHGQNAVGRG